MRSRSMTATTTSAMASLTYMLGRRSSLYVPMTCRCNTMTLPETRGPGFLMPPEVVAALCRVRDVECETKQWSHWCQWLDLQETPQKLPAALERVPELVDALQADDSVDGRYPTVSSLIQEVEQVLDNLEEPPDAIVIAGEGEPTLRLEAMLELSRACSEITTNDIPVRVSTNGLVLEPTSCTSKMKANGVESVTVSLMTADAVQYDELMQPMMLVETNESDISAHGRVCEFIREAIASDLRVEVTGVDRPEVNKNAAERLAESLGVTKPFRWRPYFP